MEGVDNWTQLGISGVTLSILFFIVRYFISALDKKDAVNLELTNRFIKIAEENTESRVNLKSAIETNTKVTKNMGEHLKKLSLSLVEKRS